MKTYVILQETIAYIEENLNNKISVFDVADKIGYSYFHLCRIFNTVFGESLGSYIKKRRLANSAKKLIFTKDKIIDIALENGFESAEAFSRAFKKNYFVSPINYRKNNLDLIISNKKAIDKTMFKHLTRSISIIPKIVNIDEIKIWGIRRQTCLKNNITPEIWNDFWIIFNKYFSNPNSKIFFGVCESCNNTCYTMNNQSSFYEFVGMAAENSYQIPDEFKLKVILKGRYAIFNHTGLICDIKKTYDYIWSTWFMNTKEQLDNREDFELYDKRFLGANNRNSQVDIYIPIK